MFYVKGCIYEATLVYLMSGSLGPDKIHFVNLCVSSHINRLGWIIVDTPEKKSRRTICCLVIAVALTAVKVPYFCKLLDVNEARSIFHCSDQAGRNLSSFQVRIPWVT